MYLISNSLINGQLIVVIFVVGDVYGFVGNCNLYLVWDDVLVGMCVFVLLCIDLDVLIVFEMVG